MDPMDRSILNLLREDARMPVSEIARRVGLSNAPVARRIEKLERTGVIKGYVTLIDDGAVGEIDAFTMVRLTGGTDTRRIEQVARQVPEVRQFFTIAGDPDAILRFRVSNVEHLERVVNAIRGTGLVESTKTLIVMTAYDRLSQTKPPQ